MLETGDMDPAYAALGYVADRFELNREQRFWLAYLYSCCYCGATAYFVYNEFPDAEVVDQGRLERWWTENRQRILFQSDRRWVRSRNQFGQMVASYREAWQGTTQSAWFGMNRRWSPEATYDAAYEEAGKLYQMGRFSLFLYLEAVHVLTGVPMEPTGLPLKESESSRNGLCYAWGLDHLLTGKNVDRKTLSASEYRLLDSRFNDLITACRNADRPGGPRSTVWNVETSLCAFKKHERDGSRWIGYYLDREHGEISHYVNAVPEGVAWEVLWDHRRERRDHAWLKEFKTK
jgi:hypothetical protein